MVIGELLYYLCVYALQSGILLSVGLLLPRFLSLRDPRISLIYYNVVLFMVLFFPLLWGYGFSANSVFGLGKELFWLLDLSALPFIYVALAAIVTVTIICLVRMVRDLLYIKFIRENSLPYKSSTDICGLKSRLDIRAICIKSEYCKVPVTFGWKRPIVLLPQDIDSFDELQKKAILCHEFLHIRRKDWLFCLLEEIFRSIFWFHPAVWILLGKIDLSREQTIDLGVVRTVGNKIIYMKVLKEFVMRSVRISHTVNSIARESQMVTRMRLLAEYNGASSASKAKIIINLLALCGFLVMTGISGAQLFPM